MPVTGTLTVNSTDLLAGYIESVRPVVVDIYAKVRGLKNMIGPMKRVEKVNDKLYRIPLKQFGGGTDAKYDPAGGVLPSGSGPLVTNLTGGYVSHMHAMSITREAEDKAVSPGARGGGAVYDFNREFAYVLENIANFEDLTLFQSGDGILTSGLGASATATVSGNTTYTFADAADFIGAKRLYEGLTVNVYNNAKTTNRANTTRPGQAFQILSVDWGTKVVTLNGIVTGAATGDVLAITGMSAVGSSGLGIGTGQPAYGQSGWPLASDTWRHGIPYWNETNTALYVLGKLRSSLPQLNPSSYAVNGSWTPFHTLFVMDKLRERRGEDALTGIVGICNMAQRTQQISIGQAVTSIMTSPGAVQKSTDLIPSDVGMDDVFTFGTVRHIVTSRQPADRVDYVKFSNWEKPMVHDLRLYPGGANGRFNDRDATTGNVKASSTIYWDSCWDFACIDPGCGAVLTGLTPYSLYN